MYQYDHFDQNFVTARSTEFRSQITRRLSGELSEDEFKPLRLQNGVYLQLHAYMLRIAIPYGELNTKQLRMLAHIAETYDKGYGHFTTRQNVQFNWPKLVDIPDILDLLASVQMHAIQTSGNCIRNVTSDAFAGVAGDELIDPRIACELLRQWSVLHPEFAFLPRKFKFAVIGASEDRAAMKFHDIGLWVRTDDQGAPIFDVWVGGGQGRTPRVARLFKQNVVLTDLLPLLDAMLRVYNLHGRRDNKYKARIKILVDEMGLEAYRDEVDAEFETLDKTPFAVVEREYTRIADNITSAAPTLKPQNSTLNLHDFDNQQWVNNNVHTHQITGHAIVTLSLKPRGGIPGDASATDMRAIAELADRYSHGFLRVTHRQNLVLPYVRIKDLKALYKELQALGLASANVGNASDIIACPGLDYCALATARSIPIAQALSDSLFPREEKGDLQGVSINISGCINACGHHHAANIGILGLNKAERENYQITLGGRADEGARVGRILGPGVDADQVPGVIHRILDIYIAERRPGEDFSAVYDRLGKDIFREAAYVDLKG